MVKIFIDAGHGGTDPGAVGNGLREKDLTLAISKRIRDILVSEYSGVEVKLSREGDQTLSLKQRTDMANAWNATYLLSVHINAGGGEGYEDFIYSGVSYTSTTAKYRDVIHAEIIKQVDFKNRGKKSANFHMVRESNMPAMLSENGFIDNANDAAKLKQSAYLDKIARGHANGLALTFGLKKKVVAPQPAPTPSNPIASDEGIGVLVVHTNTVLREQPVYTANIIKELKSGEEYVAHDYVDGWYNIGYWVFRDQVHFKPHRFVKITR